MSSNSKQKFRIRNKNALYSTREYVQTESKHILFNVIQDYWFNKSTNQKIIEHKKTSALIADV